MFDPLVDSSRRFDGLNYSAKSRRSMREGQTKIEQEQSRRGVQGKVGSYKRPSKIPNL